MGQYHNELMHEAGRHDSFMPVGQCRYCDDAAGAEAMREVHDRLWALGKDVTVTITDKEAQNVPNG